MSHGVVTSMCGLAVLDSESGVKVWDAQDSSDVQVLFYSDIIVMAV